MLHTRLSMTLLIFMCPSLVWQGWASGQVGGALSSATFISSLQWASQAFQLLSVLSKNRWCREQSKVKQKNEKWKEEKDFKENVFFFQFALSLSLQLPKGCVRDLCHALFVVLSPRFVLGISLPCCWFGSSPMLAHFFTFPSHTHTHTYTHIHTHMGWCLR